MSSWSGVSARQWLARADRAHLREDSQDFIERAAAGALVEIAETLEEISNALHKAQHATGTSRNSSSSPSNVDAGAPDAATIQRVRELHYNTVTHHPSGCCSECGGTYPCPTVRALDGGAE